MESFEEKKQSEAIVIVDKEDIRKFQAGIWGADGESLTSDIRDPKYSFMLGKKSYQYPLYDEGTES
ncbi:hypothetical protein J0K78_04395 [Halobacillus sp. GSS1]|uniref:hypothetical protein n=1 Tax=Halobacillus sp. GSS1 TaxID=2815919 RepID=UPI001A8D0442|nr:hypothetical protein [Halobacillus sp. GSS1]MBN9653499.1 hypothetical protein [Halobacillus sp. GSS1]